MTNRRSFLGLAPALLAPWPAQAQQAVTNTMVRLNTALGLIDIQLFDSAAPKTVANFLGYVRSGAYGNSMFHRSVPNFVVQGGGFTASGAPVVVQPVPAGAAVANEFSVDRSNVRGTVAMAKIGGDPNSATNQWFVNLIDNSATLDKDRSEAANGGFTVFGRVTSSGMAVFDRIAALRAYNATALWGGAFTNVPLINYDNRLAVAVENIVRTSAVTVLPSGPGESDSDRVFNYLEATYPQYVAPADAVSATGLGYYYRYYRGTNSYVGTQGGSVFYLVPALSPDITRLGSLAEWLAIAAAEGY